MKTHTILLGVILLGFISLLSYAQAPVPFLNQPLVPDATAPGGADFMLTVNGTGFVSGSVVNWNGIALPTQFASASQLTATVPAADIATASTASVIVVNPAPGGGTSNAAFFTVTANAGDSVVFGLASALQGAGPIAVTVGDFNGDGKLDLVAINQGGPATVLLGDGRGGFTQSWTWTEADLELHNPVVGDFNGDGKLDLATANAAGDVVLIFLGDGTGNFSLASSPAVDGFPNTLAAGDFNGDGKLDLAVNNAFGTLSLLFGDGTGNFTLASSLAVDSGFTTIGVGDFNSDGKLDLVIGGGPAKVLLGDGSGNFTAMPLPASGGIVVVGDFNGDAKLDVAVAQLDTNPIRILLGDGAGNFTLVSSQPTNVVYALAVGDFNGDGKLDLAVSNSDRKVISILLGDGTGNFTSGPSVNTVSWDYSIAVGDFNGDGKLDMASAVLNLGTFDILLRDIPAVTLSQSNLFFDVQPLGIKSTPQSVDMTNTGAVALDITSIVASANFSQTNNCSSSLAVGATCTIRVNFRPYRVGVINGSVTITDNAFSTTQTFSLSGTGTAITLLPSTLDFGSQPLGTTSQPQTAILTNNGTKTLSILSFRGIGQNARAFADTSTCGATLPAGGSCTFSITFTPKTKGSNSAAVKIFDSGGNSPQFVSLSGNGT
jgi:hypothetical protein